MGRRGRAIASLCEGLRPHDLTNTYEITHTRTSTPPPSPVPFPLQLRPDRSLPEGAEPPLPVPSRQWCLCLPARASARGHHRSGLHRQGWGRPYRGRTLLYVPRLPLVAPNSPQRRRRRVVRHRVAREAARGHPRRPPRTDRAPEHAQPHDTCHWARRERSPRRRVCCADGPAVVLDPHSRVHRGSVLVRGGGKRLVSHSHPIFSPFPSPLYSAHAASPTTPAAR